MTIKSLFLGAALAMVASGAFAEPVKLCAGVSNGVYYDAAEQIKAAAGRSLQIEVIETAGTSENIDRALNTTKESPDSCDAMLVQPDGMVYEQKSNPSIAKKVTQVGTLHREYLHVLCNKDSGVDDLGDLANEPTLSIAIGEEGSGAWLVWQNFIEQDESYAAARVVNQGGSTALSSIGTGDTTCGIFPTGLGSGTMNEANELYDDTIVLADANDKDFNDAVDINGKALYEYAEIPGGTYPNFRNWSDTDTLSWLARVYIVNDKISDKKTREALITSVAKASKGIKQKYGK